MPLFFESGTAHLLFKDGLNLGDLLDAKLEKRKFPIHEKRAYKKDPEVNRVLFLRS